MLFARVPSEEKVNYFLQRCGRRAADCAEYGNNPPPGYFLMFQFTRENKVARHADHIRRNGMRKDHSNSTVHTQ